MFRSTKCSRAAVLATLFGGLVAAAGVAHRASADNQTVYFDGAFVLTEWTLTNYGNRVATATHLGAGGNPGKAREVTHPLNGSSNVKAFHNLNPAGDALDLAQGAVVSLDFSIDSRFVSGVGTQGHAVRLGVVQNGIAYISSSNFATGVDAVNWSTHSINGQTATDFIRIDGLAGNPDFSTSGSPLSFGFETANGIAGQTVDQIVDYDNFTVTVHRNTLLLGDTEFVATDWSATAYTTGSGGSVTFAQNANGDPGNSIQVVNHLNGGTSVDQNFLKYLAASSIIDPANGAIDSIEMSVDAKYIAGVGGNGQQIGLAIEQNGIAYKAAGGVTGSSGNWNSISTLRLKQGDFTRFDGSAGSPNFSTGGKPVSFGFRTGNTNGAGSGAISTTVRYDNWSIQVHFIACKSDLNSDGYVDDSDFVSFATAYNILDCSDPAMPAGCPADINGDGFVDDSDFVQFAAAYDALVCP